MNNTLAILRGLSLKGRADTSALAAATGLDETETSANAAQLVDEGLVQAAGGHLRLTPAGRDRLTALLDEERTGIDQEAMRDVYAAFVPVNGDFKQLATDWQMKDGRPNDHLDAAYDQGVTDRLGDIHERVRSVLENAARLAPRLAPYEPRLQRALTNVAAGDSAWLLKPLIDSYHTVWFELHDDLILLTGRTREGEAAAGRAE